MMSVKDIYNNWAEIYDTNNNRTRDLEGIALREQLSKISFTNCLEIGCGTGKNTEWLVTQTTEIIAIDISKEMLLKAKAKIRASNVKFIEADINQAWTFTNKTFDLIVFSLVLEHIEDLNVVFEKASQYIISGGYVYIGELHPFKQYTGSKARFDTEKGQQIATCFNHHISDFTHAAKNNGFVIVNIDEYFDEGDKQSIPRILTAIFRKI